MLGLSFVSNATQRTLSQSNNIGYASRGVYRVHTVPEDRKAEYLFRDFFMTLVTAYLTELSFRTTETYYTMPWLTKYLNLDELEKWYGKADGLHSKGFKHIGQYKNIPPILRSRILGSLVREDSNYLIPKLLEGSGIKDEALVHHLQRRLNYRQYVAENLAEKLGTITRTEKDLVLQAMDAAEEKMKAVYTEIDDLKPRGFSPATIRMNMENGKLLEERMAGVEKEVLKEFAEKHGKRFSGKARQLVIDFFENEAVKRQMKKVQKTSAWPKMGVSILLNLIFYGIIANKFDFEKLQPWQKKLYERRGTTNEVVAPAYKALVPSAAVLIALMQNKVMPKAVKRMGYISRFAVAGAAALATYGVSWWAMFQSALREPPPGQAKPKPAPLPSMGALVHPTGFRMFEPAQTLKTTATGEAED